MVLRFYCKVLVFKTRSFDRTLRLSPRESAKMFFPVDCKTVGFFLKISKEIGKA